MLCSKFALLFKAVSANVGFYQSLGILSTVCQTPLSNLGLIINVVFIDVDPSFNWYFLTEWLTFHKQDWLFCSRCFLPVPATAALEIFARPPNGFWIKKGAKVGRLTQCGIFRAGKVRCKRNPHTARRAARYRKIRKWQWFSARGYIMHHLVMSPKTCVNTWQHMSTYPKYSKIVQVSPVHRTSSYCASTIWSTRWPEMMKTSAYLLDPGPRRGCCSVTLPWPRSAQTEQKSVDSVDVRTFQRDIVRQKTSNYSLDILPVLATFFGCPFDLADLVVTNFTWQVIEAHQAGQSQFCRNITGLGG